MTKLEKLKMELIDIEIKAGPYKGCVDGSYKAALLYHGYYEVLKEIEQLEKSENLQS